LHWPSVEWGLQRISSRELTEWIALAKVEAKEEEHRRDIEESGDGKVVVVGADPDDDDDDVIEDVDEG
jgi:hypothetical protein